VIKISFLSFFEGGKKGGKEDCGPHDARKACNLLTYWSKM